MLCERLGSDVDEAVGVDSIGVIRMAMVWDWVGAVEDWVWCDRPISTRRNALMPTHRAAKAVSPMNRSQRGSCLSSFMRSEKADHALGDYAVLRGR